MLAASAPTSFVEPFGVNAAAGYIRTIPTASQIGVTPGAASLNDGFPPLTFLPISAGGVPPFGQDFNGILYQTTAGLQWVQVGGRPVYNAAYASTIGGYPAGAVLQSLDGTGFWRSTADSNTSNPDTGGSNWIPSGTAYGLISLSLSNANVTLTAVQYNRGFFVLSGSLTANVQIIFPTIVGSWQLFNNTTGSYTVTCKTSAGTGVVIGQSSTSAVWGDGTNIYAGPQAIPATVAQPPVSAPSAIRNLLIGYAGASVVTTSFDSGIAATAVGGTAYTLSNFDQSVNFATTGTAALDYGTPISGTFYDIYAIYNPTSSSVSAIATLASNGNGSAVYAGSHAPSGYTVSLYLGTVKYATASNQVGGWSVFSAATAVTISGAASLTATSISSIVPVNAKAISGTIGVVGSSNGTANITVAATTASFGDRKSVV